MTSITFNKTITMDDNNEPTDSPSYIGKIICFIVNRICFDVNEIYFNMLPLKK